MVLGPQSWTEDSGQRLAPKELLTKGGEGDGDGPSGSVPSVLSFLV